MQQDIRWGSFALKFGDNSALAVMDRLKEALRPRTEYVISFYPDGTFGYYCSGKKELNRLSKFFGWRLHDTRTHEFGILTGRGYYSSDWFNACLWQCPTGERSKEIETILDYLYAPLSYDNSYFPDNVDFRHFEKDGLNCYYLYDYYRKDTKHERNDFDKRARNLIYRMLCGVQHNICYVLL
ncbi:hypothetical protein [uncultured Dysgonomonas sp.]|uniref:Uncharacterized protein n=1 Tax=uncultured Dysgonomonas sp. TaxID=206096 RepID=A0A212JNQ4_9BACT|nr:hypothetical protein [uncultured Dysgonomonas sp.]SBW01073.1 hypothetical protein KL86DYS1_20361 [uncultured Dysgonomonas sp.]